MPKPSKRPIGAVAGILAPILAFNCILLAIIFYPAFSWTNNALSDLGVVAGLTGSLFNFGLVVGGFLALIFAALGLFSYLGKSYVGRIGAAAFAFTALALICIGIFNESFKPTHYIVSVAFFASAPIALFIITSALWLNRQRRLAAFTVAIGIIAAIPWIVQFTVPYVSGVAIPETWSGLAISAWAIVLGTKMLQKP